MTSLGEKLFEVFGAVISQITSIKKDNCLSERLTNGRQCFINKKIKSPKIICSSHLHKKVRYISSMVAQIDKKSVLQKCNWDCISLGWRVADIASIGTEVGTKECSQPSSPTAFQKPSSHWEIQWASSIAIIQTFFINSADCIRFENAVGINTSQEMSTHSCHVAIHCLAACLRSCARALHLHVQNIPDPLYIFYINFLISNSYSEYTKGMESRLNDIINYHNLTSFHFCLIAIIIS